MPAESPPSLVNFLILAGLLAVELGCFIFYIVATCLSFREMRLTWRRAIVISAALALLMLPSIIVSLVHLDVSRFLQNQPPAMFPLFRAMMVLFVILYIVALLPIRAMYYHVAKTEWARVRGSWPESLAGPRPSRRLSVIVGVAVGAGILAITEVVFYFLHVGEGDGIRQMQQLFPGIQNVSAPLLFLVTSCFVISASIVEELIFRGGILGFLFRITRCGPVLAWIFIAAVSLLWAVLHIPNSDHPLAKITQIFIFGLFLGAMTRRWGLLSSVVSHATLNFGAVMAATLFPALR